MKQPQQQGLFDVEPTPQETPPETHRKPVEPQSAPAQQNVTPDRAMTLAESHSFEDALVYLFSWGRS